MTFNVQQEIDRVIKRAGGFIDRPAQDGGPINKGISLKALTLWLGREATLAELQALSTQTARDIVYANYYIKPDVKSLPELIRPVVLDAVADSGKRGIKLLQDALSCHGFDCGHIDGYIGDKTIAAAKAAAEELGNSLIGILVRRRVIYYEGQVKQDPAQRAHLAEWIARAESFLPQGPNQVSA